MSTEDDSQSATSPSLIRRVSNTNDPAAWAEFLNRYTPMIRRWCRKWFPEETDDPVQEVLAFLVNQLPKFEYDPVKGRFRGWLKVTTHHLMADLKRRWARDSNDASGALDEVAAREDLWERLAAEYDLELLEMAKERVRARVEPQTWSAYVETAEKGRKSTEVARQLHMAVGSVYQARYSVIQQLQREIGILEGPP
jgi:RNA polymerase sigma factor (sigma-70 family)